MHILLVSEPSTQMVHIGADVKTEPQPHRRLLACRRGQFSSPKSAPPPFSAQGLKLTSNLNKIKGLTSSVVLARYKIEFDIVSSQIGLKLTNIIFPVTVFMNKVARRMYHFATANTTHSLISDCNGSKQKNR